MLRRSASVPHMLCGDVAGLNGTRLSVRLEQLAAQGPA